MSPVHDNRPTDATNLQGFEDALKSEGYVVRWSSDEHPITPASRARAELYDGVVQDGKLIHRLNTGVAFERASGGEHYIAYSGRSIQLLWSNALGEGGG